MKSRLAQFVYIINKIDRRYLQFAYFIMILAGYVALKAPSDGGGGPI